MVLFVCSNEKIQIRYFRIEDAHFILKLLNTQGWINFIGNKNVNTAEDAENYIVSKLGTQKSTTGLGYFAVELKESNQPVGIVGIIQRGFLDLPDLGFAFLPEYSGQGLAGEASQLLMTYYKETMNLTTLCAITLLENERSIHLLERLGFQFKKNIKDDLGVDLNYYQNEVES